jgi:cell division protein FtsL
MGMRLLHLIVVAALVSAAASVYKLKFDSALQAERVAKLAADLRRERDAIASLRAEWSQLDNPGRIQGLAERHLKLRQIDATQFDDFAHLSERAAVPAGGDIDPIGAMIEQAPHDVTGSINAPARAR